MLTAAHPLKAILDASMAEYKSLIATEKLECDWTEKGLLYVLQSERGMQAFSKKDRLLTEHFGVSARRIGGKELPDFDAALKPGLAGAFHYPGDASVRPDLLNAQWAQRLRERGVTFIEHCRFTNLQKTDGKITGIEPPQGTLPADRFVFATGAWSSHWSDALECRIPVEPGKGYSVTMARPSICPEHPMLFPEHSVGATPFANGYRLGSMMEFSGFDTSIPKHRIQQLRDSAAPYLVEPHAEPEQDVWHGWRPMTWDSLPIIGKTPKLSNGYLATGHNMLGLSLATATGRLLAELIHKQTPHIDPAPYSPARFNP